MTGYYFLKYYYMILLNIKYKKVRVYFDFFWVDPSQITNAVNISQEEIIKYTVYDLV